MDLITCQSLQNLLLLNSEKSNHHIEHKVWVIFLDEVIVDFEYILKL